MKWLKEIKQAFAPAPSRDHRAKEHREVEDLTKTLSGKVQRLRKVTQQIPRRPFPSVAE